MRAFLILPVLCGLAASCAQAQTVATAKRETLLQADHSWNGVKYGPYESGTPLLTTIRITIPMHTALPWHQHPVPNAGYVLQGELTIHDRDSGVTKTYHQGEAFAESMNDVHRGEATGNTDTILLLTYAGVAGVPTSIPAKGEKPEY